MAMSLTHLRACSIDISGIKGTGLMRGELRCLLPVLACVELKAFHGGVRGRRGGVEMRWWWWCVAEADACRGRAACWTR